MLNLFFYFLLFFHVSLSYAADERKEGEENTRPTCLVYFVDDERDIRDSFEAVVEKYNEELGIGGKYRVLRTIGNYGLRIEDLPFLEIHLFEGGTTALRAYDDAPIKPHAVITDCDMGIPNGKVFAELLRNRDFNRYIHMATSNVAEENFTVNTGVINAVTGKLTSAANPLAPFFRFIKGMNEHMVVESISRRNSRENHACDHMIGEKQPLPLSTAGSSATVNEEKISSYLRTIGSSATVDTAVAPSQTDKKPVTFWKKARTLCAALFSWCRSGDGRVSPSDITFSDLE
jgi:hypothetical protein